MTPLITISIVLSVGLIYVVFIFARYKLSRAGSKDNKYPTVQHVKKSSFDPVEQGEFLPGSRAGMESPSLSDYFKKKREEESERKVKLPPIFRSKNDLRRAFLIEELLRRKDDW